MSNSAARYGPVTKILHWTVFLLILNQFVAAAAMLTTPQDETTWGFSQGTLYNWHKSIGLIVLAVAVLRYIWRRSVALPDWAPNQHRREARNQLDRAHALRLHVCHANQWLRFRDGRRLRRRVFWTVEPAQPHRHERQRDTDRRLDAQDHGVSACGRPLGSLGSGHPPSPGASGSLSAPDAALHASAIAAKSAALNARPLVPDCPVPGPRRHDTKHYEEKKPRRKKPVVFFVISVELRVFVVAFPGACEAPLRRMPGWPCSPEATRPGGGANTAPGQV